MVSVSLPGVYCIGLAESLPAVLAHLGRRHLRRLWPAAPTALATRAEEIPPVRVANLRPRIHRLPAYLALTDGADLAGHAGRFLPPLYPTAWGLRPMLALLDHPKLAVHLAGVVHAQNDLIVHAPLPARAPLTIVIRLERLHRDAARALLVVRSDILAGQTLLSEMRATLLAGLSPADAEQRARESEAATPLETRGWTPIREIHLGAHHALRYALLSGDVNPIHLHPLTSRPLGFERPILHGFCLKALVAHALIRWGGGGDPGSLRRLRIRFRRAVRLPARLAVEVQGPEVRVRCRDSDHVCLQGRYRLETAGPRLTPRSDPPTMPRDGAAPAPSREDSP